ncbi:FHA domain-containing protein [Aphelenchoides besseyi]|nr:FHA domain-containing protein [Aphelenchoides besseyi]KAI6193865.1 FHA domain-containing protein [Aphelenchoides besseyi]
MASRPSTAASSQLAIPSPLSLANFWTNGIDGLVAHPIDRNPMFIGSLPTNEIVVQSKRVFPRHALIEYHPLTRSFWLRDLQSGQQGGVLGQTTCNSRVIYGMVELRSGDTLRFGESSEFVFEMPTIPQKQSDKNVSRSKRRAQTSSTENESTDPESVTLPAVSGSRITPKDPRERFVRPVVSNHRLCQLRNVPRLVDTGKSLSQAADVLPNRQKNTMRRSASMNDKSNNESRRKKRATPPVVQPPPSSSTSTERERWSDLGIGIDTKHPTTHESQLVQRIVRLQNELQRRDLEIAELRERLAARESASLPKLNENSSSAEKSAVVLDGVKFNDIIYDTFFMISGRELEELSRRISLSSMRDYGDVFSEAYRILQEPFACRLMEINTKCGGVFERLEIKEEERELLYEKFDNFFRDRINPISKSLDAFLPILKDAAHIARESVRACNVFSQWSREFGDQLQLRPDWSRQLYKVEDLQTRFREHSLSKHWLEPSLTPLLKILIYEYRNKCEEIERRDHDHKLSVQRLTEKVAELEMKVDQQQQRLEANNPTIVADNNMQEREDLAFLRDENETLRTANVTLQSQLNELKKTTSRKFDTEIPRGSVSTAPSRIPRSARPQSAFGERLPLALRSNESPQLRRTTADSLSSCSQSSEEIIQDNDELEDEETDNEYEDDNPKTVIQNPKVETQIETEQLNSNKELESKPVTVEESEEAHTHDAFENVVDDLNQTTNNDDDHFVSPPNEDKNNEENDFSGNERDKEDFNASEEENRSNLENEDPEDDLFIDEPELDNRKDTQATEADIDAEILDRGLFSSRRASEPADFVPSDSGNERQQNAIEFWELAKLLATALSVELPTIIDADFSSIDLDEGVYVERHRRELAVDAILDKLRDLLERIRAAEQERGLTSRQISVRSSKSIENEHRGRLMNRVALHHVSSIDVEGIEGESAI